MGQNVPAAEEDTAYREMFDKDGRFNRDLAKEYLDKEDYEQVRHVWLEVQTFILILMIRWKRLRASKMASIIRFFWFSTFQQLFALLQIKLQSQYEEGITGVHLMNKYQQQYAMDEFVAGEDIVVANIDCQ